MSLPGILGTTLSTIPAEVPYLFADANLVKQWRQKLAGLGEFKIGIAWEGNPGYKANRVRSCGRAAFAPLARLEGVRLISLQKGTGADKPADDANSFFVTDLGSDFDKVSGAFMDTAAVMEQLELVVSVDTSVAHCAGALGVPVWVALPFAPDWRWLLEREDSPWYPTMRLFRQRRWGDWDEVFQRIADEVQKLLLLRDRLGEDLSAKKASVSSDRRGIESICTGGTVAAKGIGPSPAQGARPKLPADFALYQHVLRENAPVDKLIFWVRGTRSRQSQQWVRLVTLSPVRLSVCQGVCTTPASLTPFRQDMRNFLLRFFSRKGSADRFILPDGNWVEKDGSSRSDVLLAWSAKMAPLDRKRVTELWPEHEECQQLGPGLVVLVGVV